MAAKRLYFPIRQNANFSSVDLVLRGSRSPALSAAAVLALLTCVAAVAGYLPARRASRLNPFDTLRSD